MGRGEAYTGFWWGNLRERGPLVIPRRRWEDNIKMDLQEVGCGGIDWIEVFTLYCWAINSRRMRQTKHVARMGREEAYTGFWWGNLRERGPLVRPRRRWD